MSKELELIAEHHAEHGEAGSQQIPGCWCGWQGEVLEHPPWNPIPGVADALHAAHVVEMLSEHGYSIVHHRPTCAEAGDSCKHLPECVMAICVCGEEWPCPTVAAAAEEDQ